MTDICSMSSSSPRPRGVPGSRPDARDCSRHRGDGERQHRDRSLPRVILRGHGLAVKTRAERCGGGAGGHRRLSGAAPVAEPRETRNSGQDRARNFEREDGCGPSTHTHAARVPQEAVSAFSGLLDRGIGSSTPAPSERPVLYAKQVAGHVFDANQNSVFFEVHRQRREKDGAAGDVRAAGAEGRGRAARERRSGPGGRGWPHGDWAGARLCPPSHGFCLQIYRHR